MLSSGAARSAAADAAAYGGFWIRTLAYSADGSILILGLMVVAVPFTFLGGAGMALYGAVATVGPFAYFVWFTSSARQATFGKQLCGLKVEHAGTGERISILRSLGRELGKFVSAAVLCLGFLIVAFTRRKQGLHDLLATTVVVREGPARILLAVIVTIAGIVVPFIVIPLMFGAMLAGLMMMLMGSAASGMLGGSEMKQVKPVPRMEQPAQRPRPTSPLPQSSAPKPAVTASATAGVPQSTPRPAAGATVKPETVKPEAVVAMTSKSQAASEAESGSSVSSPAAALKPATRPTTEVAAKPAGTAAASRPRAADAVFIPPSSPGPAIAPKFNDLMTAVLYGDADGVAELLKLGKWVDKPDSQGLTPLMSAVQKGDARTAELLLKGGADPNLSSNGGASAGSIARGRHDGAMLALLQQHGLR